MLFTKKYKSRLVFHAVILKNEKGTDVFETHCSARLFFVDCTQRITTVSLCITVYH